MKIRFFSVLISVLFVVSMFAIPVFAAESFIVFSPLADYLPEEVVTAVFTLAGATGYDSDLIRKVISSISGDPVYISEDHNVVVVESYFFDDCLSVFEDEEIATFLPDNYYLTEYNDYYFVVPVSLTYFTISSDSDDQLYLRSVYSPTDEPSSESSPDAILSNTVDSSMISTVLNEILDVLPIVVSVIIGFIGLRKGIGFVKDFLRNG